MTLSRGELLFGLRDPCLRVRACRCQRFCRGFRFGDGLHLRDGGSRCSARRAPASVGSASAAGSVRLRPPVRIWLEFRARRWLRYGFRRDCGRRFRDGCSASASSDVRAVRFASASARASGRCKFGLRFGRRRLRGFRRRCVSRTGIDAAIRRTASNSCWISAAIATSVALKLRRSFTRPRNRRDRQSHRRAPAAPR